MDRDTDWQGLKSAWQASAPLENLAATALRGSLLWRIWASRAWLALEIVSYLFIGAVFAVHLALGQFAQATVVGLLMAFCLAASIWARRGRLVGNLDSIAGMIDLTLSRARKSLRMVYGTYAVIGLCFIALLIGAERPFTPEGPFIVKFTWLVFSTGVAVAYHVYLQARVRRFESIQRSFNERRQ